MELGPEQEGSVLAPVPFPRWAEGGGHEDLTLFHILSCPGDT